MLLKTIKGNKMIQTFQIINVKCSGCAKTLEEGLFEQFGKVEVDLSVEPRQITLDIEEKEIPLLGSALKKLGYPFVTEEMGFVESTSAKAKSFVSCAIGKMNT